MKTLTLALRSLRNRRTTALLTLAAIAVSVALLLGVQKTRTAAREGFANTVSGVDLIVGARSGQLNLLLYSVFRVGDATANVSWETYQKVAGRSDVAWTIPLSLGDSHRGFRVLGTNLDYFRHYRFAGGRELSFDTGKPFTDLYDTVLGAEVAQQLGYRLGDPIVIAHGLGKVSFANHEDKPFRVVGILARTGTPVDRTVHVSLEALTAIHIDWQSGMRALPGAGVDAETARTMALTPTSITAFMVGMENRVMTFGLQRAVNDYRQEALLAIIPGVALTQLWNLVGIADTALMIIAAFVVLAGLLGMLTAILTSLNERRREMAILRSVGAHASVVFGLMLTEAAVLTALGALLGTASLYLALFALQPLIDARFGLFLPLTPPTPREVALLAGVVIGGTVAGLLPALRAYRLSLADGMTVRT